MGVPRNNVHRSNNPGYRFGGGGGGKCVPKCAPGQICKNTAKAGQPAKYECVTLFTDDDQDPLGSGRGGFGYRSAVNRRPQRRRLGSSAYQRRTGRYRFSGNQQQAAIVHQAPNRAQMTGMNRAQATTLTNVRRR